MRAWEGLFRAVPAALSQAVGRSMSVAHAAGAWKSPVFSHLGQRLLGRAAVETLLRQALRPVWEVHRLHCYNCAA